MKPSTSFLVSRRGLPAATRAEARAYYSRGSSEQSADILFWLASPIVYPLYWLGLAVLAVAGWLTRGRS